MDVEFGNAGALDTAGTGWFIGYSDWTRQGLGALRHVPAESAARGLCVKWFQHAAGDPDGQPKPLSIGRTISLLVSERSVFRLEFCAQPDFAPDATLSHTLRRQGDFALWGRDLYHRAFGIEPACILTLRWNDDSS